jgi:hypothetical protein
VTFPFSHSLSFYQKEIPMARKQEQHPRDDDNNSFMELFADKIYKL